MRSVKIADLKARLSSHLERVRRGEEVLVCDREQPIARIVPCSTEDLGEQERRLVARDVLAPPRKMASARASWPQPPGNVSDEVIAQVWRDERAER